MKAFVILSCAAAVAVAQHRPLKDASHFHAITEPHLPRDPNVLLATQNFLNQYAELKALADAAPDPPPRPTGFVQRPVAIQRPIPVHPPPTLPSAHRFAPQPVAAPVAVAPPSPPPSPAPIHVPHQRQFDVHGEIRSLLNKHRPRVVPTFAPAPVAPSPTPAHAVAQPAPTFAPAHRPSPAVRFPSFSVMSNVGGHQRAINSHQVTSTGFAPDVLAAQKDLAAAHHNILRQQAALAPRFF
ncbi:protein tonB2-like isoform X2 [Portunus trituberculatus]|uniref:protein tonB2-like isoform X2 n=1 Tax=Portunus trituberculatus TaxID=210409 RepID=UPI001E1CC1D5|nr:protein tonB2-like isoform X2 [Portunus trituberculatus]